MLLFLLYILFKALLAQYNYYIFVPLFGDVAQLVEHRTENP